MKKHSSCSGVLGGGGGGGGKQHIPHSTWESAGETAPRGLVVSAASWSKELRAV